MNKQWSRYHKQQGLRLLGLWLASAHNAGGMFGVRSLSVKIPHVRGQGSPRTTATELPVLELQFNKRSQYYNEKPRYHYERSPWGAESTAINK